MNEVAKCEVCGTEDEGLLVVDGKCIVCSMEWEEDILLRARAIRTSSLSKEEKRRELDCLCSLVQGDHNENSIELLWLLELGHLAEHDLLSLEIEDTMDQWDNGTPEVQEELQRLHAARAI